MTPRESIDKVLSELSDARLYEVLDFVRYLRWLEEKDRLEREDWQRFCQMGLAEAYGPDEPEYTEADIKPELNPSG